MTGDIAWRINAERIVLLGWARAILLQLAHPLVAAGVTEHSAFREGRLTAALRLHQTVRSMLSLAFGDEGAQAATLETIKGIHRRVHGVLPQDVGVFAAGTRYSAEDPSLLLWVHATLIESVVIVYERLVAPLTDLERDRYCAAAAPVAHALGAGAGVPETWPGVGAYLTDVIASGRIAVGAQARELAGAVLAPPMSWAVAPAAHVNRLFAVGLLPPAIRRDYGFRWSAGDDRALARWTRVLRRARRALPDAVALWPDARR